MLSLLDKFLKHKGEILQKKEDFSINFKKFIMTLSSELFCCFTRKEENILHNDSDTINFSFKEITKM